MPNLDFYAHGSDFDPLLEHLFEMPGLRIFEMYSYPDCDLVEFRSVHEIRSRYPVGECKGTVHSAHLQLWPTSAGGRVEPRKFGLDPTKCGGATFRYCLEGVGLIQFYIGGRSPYGVLNSHTNHMTEKGVCAGSVASEESLRQIASWNWKEVHRVSSALNRHIRRNSVLKVGSRPVLPAAAALYAEGFPLLP